jgi:hypothetical protein
MDDDLPPSPRTAIEQEQERLGAADSFIANTRRQIERQHSRIADAATKGFDEKDEQAILRNLESSLETVLEYRRRVGKRLNKLRAEPTPSPPPKV